MLIQKKLLEQLIELASDSAEYLNSSEHWITVKPHGAESKGTHVLVKDGETSKEAVDRKFGKDEKEPEPNYTKIDVINKGWQNLKAKIGEKKAKKYFEQADRLINPNEHNIVEYRESGIITKEKDKYTFHALSDMSFKQWRIGFKIDVSDQF